MSRKYALSVTGGCNVANAAPTPDCRLQSPPDHANASQTATLFSQLSTIKLSVTVVFHPPLLASPDPLCFHTFLIQLIDLGFYTLVLYVIIIFFFFLVPPAHDVMGSLRCVVLLSSSRR